MILFENISKSYSNKALFENLTFMIGKGEKCALIGRNGCGKTTLFRLMIKNQEVDAGVISIPKNYIFGYLDQHILFSEDTVLKEALLSLSKDQREDTYKVEKILFGLGFEKEDMQKNPNDFSGGYQLRLHLAKVLICEPSCLLLDEPTNYLDIVSISWLKRFLKKWKGEFVIISHDRDFLDSICTHTIGIHRGNVHKVKGDTRKLFDLIVQEEEVFEKTRKNLDKKRQKMESFITRFSAKATKAAQAQSKQKALEKLPSLERLVSLQELQFYFNEKPFPSKKLLSAESINFSYEDKEEKNLIDDFSLFLEKGQKIAIIGKNGYGKSTILKLLAKEIDPISGNLFLSDNASIGYFAQTNINRLNNSLSIEEEIASSNKELNISQIRSICGLMMFAQDDAKKKVQVLSGGEKSRVLLGKIIASPCNLLLLDEPTNHLDIESIEALLEALEGFSGSVVIVTHSEMILRRLSLDKLVICDQNRQEVFLGGYNDFLEKKGWPDSKNIPSKKIIERRDIRNRKNEIKQKKIFELRDIKKQITKLENEITFIEKKIVIDNQKLIEASENSNSVEIVKLSKNVSEDNLKLDLLFDELEKVYLIYENKKSFFDKQLDELN